MKYEEIKLSELVDTISDTRKIDKDKVILVNTSDVLAGDVLNHTYTDNCNLRGQFKKRFKQNDILYSEIRPANKRFAYVDFDSEDYIASTKLMVLRRKSDKITNRYLYYCLTSDSFIERMQHLAESRSGTFPQITFDVLKAESIYLPSVDNQNKITNILDSINNKVKINNEINNNLYDIGLSLLNNYFYGIDDKALLNKVITFVKGKKPKIIKTVKEETYLKYLTIAGLNGQESNYADTEKMLIANQDLLMVMDGASSGDIYYSDYGVVGSTLSRLDIIDEEYIKEYIFFCLKKYNSLIKSKNTGSAIPHTDKVFIGTLEIPKLDKNKQNQFKSLLEKVQENLKENEILIKLRDTLLPKLMNGEIDLENVEI